MAVTPSYVRDPNRIARDAFYSIVGVSGLLTTVAARTASAGHVFAARFASASKVFAVTRLRVYWQTIAGFTAAQEMALAAFKLTSYSAAHTGGTAITALARSPEFAASGLSARIGTTGALTAGTQTIGAQLLQGSFSELADSSLLYKGFIDEQREDPDHPICVLENEEGILVSNEILMGAGGTGRLTVEIDGFERNG
jgi:hypothetical protein